ncbi:DUF2239 family protein [Reyranella sp. CPCC 100927]|uniref:DUF2239 family protein n=1 Tax=Reyranella sp. CPCC 100927 TaxID=2599616 RepID=UPI0011B6340D|nr:DUF2239 family protein [Reyranella sp. CPCC 100927]TWT15120.1 DUF2239 family protein [Reyranella sp. CPCC 100927]
MTDPTTTLCTAFEGHRRLAAGPLVEVALAVKAAGDGGTTAPLLIFNDATGRVIDVDLRGTTGDIAARLSSAAAPRPDDSAPPPRGRGRPRLGVIGREVTLLPRHWTWLAAQPGGASVALRRLVDAARRFDDPRQKNRAAQEIAYRFMSALAGNLPGFEEAARALFAHDPVRFAQHAAGWPRDVRGYATRLAFGDPSD